MGREALYIISVAARLVEMHPSTLRKYERIGLLEPSRLGGKLRLYSSEDIARLRQIKQLVEDRGVNLAGIELALDITDLLQEVLQTLEQSHDADEIRRELRPLIQNMLNALGADGEPSSASQRTAELSR